MTCGKCGVGGQWASRVSCRACSAAPTFKVLDAARKADKAANAGTQRKYAADWPAAGGGTIRGPKGKWAAEPPWAKNQSKQAAELASLREELKQAKEQMSKDSEGAAQKALRDSLDAMAKEAEASQGSESELAKGFRAKLQQLGDKEVKQPTLRGLEFKRERLVAAQTKKDEKLSQLRKDIEDLQAEFQEAETELAEHKGKVAEVTAEISSAQAKAFLGDQPKLQQATKLIEAVLALAVFPENSPGAQGLGQLRDAVAQQTAQDAKARAELDQATGAAAPVEEEDEDLEMDFDNDEHLGPVAAAAGVALAEWDPAKRKQVAAALSSTARAAKAQRRL